MPDKKPPVPPVPPAPDVPPVPPAPPAAPDAIVPPQPNPYVPPAAQPNPYAQSDPYAQPAAQPNPYAQPYGAPGYAPAPRTNTMAIVGFVLAFVVSVAGIVCSHIALSQIKKTGEGGHGLALAGLILSYVFTAFWLLYFIGIILAIVISAASGYSTYPG